MQMNLKRINTVLCERYLAQFTLYSAQNYLF